MVISGLVKSSLVDFPGLVACVLFVPGCNYNCFYCHNRQLLNAEQDILTAESIMDFLRKRAGLLDGVVITGGEPTLQADLIQFMKTIKDLGYKIKLDTNGSSPSIIENILENGLCNYFAVDYKAPSARYEEICGRGVNPRDVLNTIALLLERPVDFEVRTTIIPQLDKNDLITMAQELPVVPRYVLNRYRIPETYLECDRARVETKPYTQQEITGFADLLKQYQPNVIS